MNAFFISEKFKKDDFFEKIIIKDLKFYTDSNIRDSRDKKYNLNFLTGEKKLKEIRDCEVINLENENYNLVKIKDLV